MLYTVKHDCFVHRRLHSNPPNLHWWPTCGNHLTL